MLTLPQEPEQPKMPSLIQGNKHLALAFSNECSLARYRSVEEKSFLQAHFVENIATYLQLLNIARNMTAAQITIVAEMILEQDEFKYMKPSEVCEAIKKGVAGEYGELYQSVGVDTIFSWMRKYWTDRMEQVERYREAEISSFKSESAETLKAIPTEVLKKIAEPLEKKSRKNEQDFDEYARKYAKAEITAKAELKDKIKVEVLSVEQQLEFISKRVNQILNS